LRRLAGAAVLVAAVLSASGCGADESRDESQLLPRDLGAKLAQRSGDVQRALEGGNDCAAKQQAGRLRADVERAIADGLVSGELESELRERAERLESSIVCVAPPPPPPPSILTETTDEEDKEEKEDKKEGKKEREEDD
jgi:ribosomal protein L12E/L44/L45/RPP1/RPP2